jgi:hypothetical protein
MEKQERDIWTRRGLYESKRKGRQPRMRTLHD